MLIIVVLFHCFASLFPNSLLSVQCLLIRMLVVRLHLTSGWLCRCPWLLPFSLQPVRDTREKQIQLWKELILDYCKTQKTFVIALEEEFPLFTNHVIESKLKILLLCHLCEVGKSHNKCSFSILSFLFPRFCCMIVFRFFILQGLLLMRPEKLSFLR